MRPPLGNQPETQAVACSAVQRPRQRRNWGAPKSLGNNFQQERERDDDELYYDEHESSLGHSRSSLSRNEEDDDDGNVILGSTVFAPGTRPSS